MRAVIACLALAALTLLTVSAHIHDEDDVVIVPVGVPVCIPSSCTQNDATKRAPNILEPESRSINAEEAQGSDKRGRDCGRG